MERKISENMKEIREAALAYREYMPEIVNEKARSLFQSMDTSGDNKISYAELSKHYKQPDVSADQHVDKKLFEELDENGDGYLNFDEFVTLFYIVHSGRLMYCDGCQHFLKGLYFTCLPCFDQGQTIVNYCTACYRKGDHRNHQHINGDVDVKFVDNYALLLSKVGSSNGAAESTQADSSYGEAEATQEPNCGEAEGTQELSYDAAEATQEPSFGVAGATQSGPTQRGQPSKSQMVKETAGRFFGIIGVRTAGKAAGQATGKVTEAAGKAIEAVEEFFANYCSFK